MKIERVLHKFLPTLLKFTLLLFLLVIPQAHARDDLARDLIGYWKFDEDTGRLANDSSGFGNNGTHVSAPVTSTDVSAKFRFKNPRSLKFDGTDDYIEIGDDSIFDFGNGDFTVSFWANKKQTSSGFDNIWGVTKWNTGSMAGTNEWVVIIGEGQLPGNADQVEFWIEDGTTTYRATSPDKISLNTWYHVAGQRSGANIKLFVDGVEKASRSVGNASVNNVGRTVRVATSASDSLHTDAAFDEIRIYNRALTLREIQFLAAGYNEIKPGLAAELGPQFDQGKSVLGKVFWDFNQSGYQDAGEYGVEGVKVVSDTGIYAITDEDGKYHYPFIQVGQRILKLDPITLPVGATVTTENPRKIIVTEGILTKVSFGLYGQVSEVVTEDNDLLLKVSIAQDPSKLAPQLSVSAEVTQDKIIFTINTNYHLFIKRAELKLFDQNQNLIQSIELPEPLPLHHEIPFNDAVAYFQLSVYDTHNNEDRTSLAQIPRNAA